MASRALAIEAFNHRQASADTNRRSLSRVHALRIFVSVTRENDAGLFPIKDISDQGVLLATLVPFSIGESVTLAFGQLVSVQGKVIRTEEKKCAVRFDEPIDSAGLLATISYEDERRQSLGRIPANLKATAVSLSGRHDIDIFDVSRGGVGVRHDGAFHPGMFVKLVLGQGTERSGVVRWSEDGQAGIYLIEPFDCGQLQSVSRL